LYTQSAAHEAALEMSTLGYHERMRTRGLSLLLIGALLGLWDRGARAAEAPVPLPNPLHIAPPVEVLRVDYFAQPDLPSQQQTEYFNLEHRGRIALNASGALGAAWRLGAKLEYEYTLFHRRYEDVRDTISVHAISLRPVLVYARNRWAVVTELGPGVASTFQSPFSYRDWRLKVFAMAMYTLRANLVLRFGLFGSTGFTGNTFFGPAVGISWRPRPSLLLDLFVPLWISFYYTPVPFLTLFVRSIVDLISFDETSQGPGREPIRDSPIIGYPRTSAGVRFTPRRGVQLELATGLSTEGSGSFFERRLQMTGFRFSLFAQGSFVITADLFQRRAWPASRP
jgi:hypothetical protein